jgi:lysophospholipase L1-like esterase
VRLVIVALLGIMLCGGCHSSEPLSNDVAIIGDSYTGGSPSGGKGGFSWPNLAVEQIRGQGIDIDVVIGCEGGSGYVKRGNNEGRVFEDLVGEVVRTSDQLVVIFGSSNDARVPSDELVTAVHRTLGSVRAAAPNAALLIIGPAYVKSPNPGMLRARDAVKNEAESVGATFIDTFADEWFVGRSDLIGADGSHPNDAGHEYMADRIAPLITQHLPQLGGSP